MMDRKLRRQNKENKENKEIKPNKVLNIASKVLITIFAILLIAVLGVVIYLNILPVKYLVPLCIIALIITALGVFVVFKKRTSNVFKTIISAVALIGTIILTFVGLKLVKTLDFLGNMTTETVNSKTYSVVVLKDSEYTKLEDIQYKILLYYDNELNQNKNAIDKITTAMVVVDEKTDDVHELADRLINNEVDAILIEDSYYDIIEEKMADFKEKTKVIYTFALEDVIQTIAKDVSVTKEPFNIFISGIDSYGKISAVSRSDVNMVVSVNPQTKQILLVNTPRDYYVKLHDTSGYRDKLTHAGIYGIDMSVKTMEDLYDIDINYYVRVNFTSLIDIIDAIGGVNVYSEYDFTSRVGKYHFVKGYNQMNGHQALGFARERYSFSEGDRMRGKNQQAVIDAVIKKVCSSTTILTKFDSLLDSLEGSFQTNMDYTKMVELVRMQISDNAEWTITSISVDGLGSSERTYSMGKTLLYVMIPYAGSVEKAQSMIKSVLDGETLEGGSVDLSDYNDYPVVSRGNYPTEEEKEPEKPEEEKPNENENQENTGDNTETPTPDTGNEPNAGDGTETPTPGTGNEPNTGDNTETPTPGTGNEPNAGDNTETPTPDAGNEPNAGDNTETPTPDTGNEPNAGDNTETPTPDAGNKPNTGDNTQTENQE